ncbi:MAG: hypothetical protein G01um101470_478 [Parcubacteria group bacterium Gr01-1014_70]|nr:MAG: hypothetical protein G01um101470_478 [Parcubacteria group bacterium Gr01-1014_70]
MSDISKYVFREVNEQDIEPLYNLAVASNYHSDNLPQDVSLIETDIHKAVIDFSILRLGGVVRRPLFMFVLEDTETHSVVGCSRLSDVPFRLLYELRPDLYPSLGGDLMGELSLRKEVDVWELGALLLSESVRGMGLGKLLSYGRFLYALHANLKPRMLISGFVATHPFLAHMWEKELSTDDKFVNWRDAGKLYEYWRRLPERISLQRDFGYVGDPTHVEVQPLAQKARKMLMGVGFTFLRQIEATGVLWYGTNWQIVQLLMLSRKISPGRIRSDGCKKACYTNFGVVVLRSPYFRCCYVPVDVNKQKLVHVSENDMQLGNLSELYVFEK